MKSLIALLSLVVVFSSCTFHEPAINGVDDVQFHNFDGKSASFNVKVRVQNDNGFGIKVKPSTLDVYLGDDKMGKIHLDKKVKAKRKQETVIDAPFTATFEDGALFKMMKHINGDELNVRLKGKVKAGVWFIGKKIDVDESKSIDKSMLKLPM